MNSIKKLAMALASCAVLTATATTPPEAQRIERLVGLGKLWGKVRFLHPDLTSQSIDWDKALVDGVAKVRQDGSQEDFTDAVSTMLSALGDPATKVVMARNVTGPEPSPASGPFTWVDPNTLLIHMNDIDPYVNSTSDLKRFTASCKAEMAKARRIVIDLRLTKSLASKPIREIRSNVLRLGFVFDAISPDLIDQPLTLPAARVVSRNGYRGDLETVYTDGVRLVSGKTFQPLRSGNAPRLGFLVNDASLKFPQVLALKNAGRAVLVTEGDPSRDWAAKTRSMELPGGLVVDYKVEDLVFEDESTHCVADSAVPASPLTGPENPGIQAILRLWDRLAARPAPDRGRIRSLFPRFIPDNPYREMDLPSREYRILAAIKFWTTIDQFYPYKKGLESAWDDARLAGFIQSLEAVKDRLGYELAVAAMQAKIQDSHGYFSQAIGSLADGRQEPEEFKAYLGTGGLPFMVQILAERPVITRAWGPEPAGVGLRLGDAIISVDGEDVSIRIARIRPYVSASTPQSLDLLAANHLLRGPLKQQGVVKVQHADGALESVQVTWAERTVGFRGGRLGTEFQLLENNVGYVDLDRIPVAKVEAMYKTLSNTKAVIFDMRGYPTSGSNPAARRFLKPGPKLEAISDMPLVQGDLDEGRQVTLREELSAGSRVPSDYQGKIVMLIDERSWSAAEHLGLILEGGAEPTFIGSPTSGANGEVTTVTLPGALRLFFTGRSIVHGDGSQLQRKGLQPHIFVRPTAAGLADGRDEVLERAIKFIEEGR